MRDSVKKGDQVYVLTEEYYSGTMDNETDNAIIIKEVIALFTSLTDACLHRTSLERMRGRESRFKIKGYTLDYQVDNKKTGSSSTTK